MPNVGEFCCLGMWMNKTVSMSFASRRMCGSMLAAWRQGLPVAIKHGLSDMPRAMMMLVRTFVRVGPCMPAKFGILTCCSFKLVASPAYSLSCCPFASMFWGCVAPWPRPHCWMSLACSHYKSSGLKHVWSSSPLLALLPEAIRCYERQCEQMWSCQRTVTRLGVHGEPGFSSVLVY
jgi:hypothetical protein